jgi:hypothetical protein
VAVGEVRRQQVEPVGVGALELGLDVGLAAHQLSASALDLRLDPEQVRARALRVEVPQQRAVTVARGQRGEVDGRRGLPDAALDVVGREDHPNVALTVRR